MSSTHEFEQQFVELLAATQASYAERDADGYLSAFADDYYSVQIDHSFGEDRVQLAEKITRDIERFDIVQMDFTVKRSWFTGDTGFAHLAYLTRMRFKDSGRSIRDKRENLIVGRHLGAGHWELTCKVILRAETVVEQEQVPEI